MTAHAGHRVEETDVQRDEGVEAMPHTETRQDESTTLVLETSRGLERDLQRWRRDFHRHPEPGFGEFRTSSTIVQRLRELGYEVKLGRQAMDPDAVFHLPAGRVQESYARALQGPLDRDLLAQMDGGLTAVIADLRTGAGPTLAFRFDMDALPVTESSEAQHRPQAEGFASGWSGYMHACGHDGHMAMGLGVASVLAQLRGRLRGTVRLIFQPAEEGALGGAAAIAARGHLDDVDYLVCCHLGLGAPTGVVVCRANFMATSKYRVRFLGRGAHVTNSPQSGRNALLAAASAALALHSIPPHSEGWFSLNVGVLTAGEEQGVTPRAASMDMGFWASTPAVHAYVQQRVREILAGTASTWGVELELQHIGEAPAVAQDAELAAIAEAVAARVPGVQRVDNSVDCRAGEDATILVERAAAHGGKGIYMLIGSTLAAGHHAPTFDFDEASLGIGTGVLGALAARLLGDHVHRAAHEQ
jgi:aminobenzoyl-glutamate utilization protein A